ncbi:hypothetical protein ASPWEDRAFT_278209 [Aspergillus wentii DTO 134E9]|uniref:DUF8035 domain-containing protein n=1 Tax=Aspergillus wentii DTO 134E9 TaxID=1073089 RepID=A0A1L9S3B0_ASPWE|nr:uncharacterized protein ASPWEDRAFT_278209 [Aspergillus wentii DTO 134E9]OJJ41633.1 hypothetical protein ASPWEDRAFT_278209 [Aspergillus wentii DTO 134E9]
MDPSARYRPMSPAGRMIDPMRASTGTMQLSSYDPYEPPAPRYAYNYSGYPPDVPYHAPYDPRLHRESTLEARPIASKAYRDHGHPKLRTEYAVRPRQRSNTASAADIPHSPLRVAIPSSPLSRQPPIISSSYDRPTSPLPADERYMVPASSRHGRAHRRLYSNDYSSDTGRLGHNDKAMVKSRVDPGAYRAYEARHPPRYPHNARKGEDIDDYDAYSYTNPREQFEKDSAARMSYDRGVHRRERPLSMTGIEDIPHLMAKKEPRTLGPPPSSRGFDKLEREARVRSSTLNSGDSDASRDFARSRRRSRQRTPIALHQESDDGYSSLTYDLNDSRQHRRRRRPRPEDEMGRQPHDDRALRKITAGESVASRSSAGLGTAGLGYSDDFDYELSPRSDRHRPRAPGYDEHRHHNRSSRPSRRRVESDSDAYTSDEDLKDYRREPAAPKAPGSDSSAGSGKDQSQHLTVARPRRRSKSRPRILEASPTQEPGSGSSQEDLKTSVTVDPTPTKELEAPPPRGILKPPREKFPEEPNPVREGVAPLKDAHKKGIPPGARWTKVDRRLVNPAALEASNERFEERSEYVIVLRVLTKEEIQAFAVKTQEIRGKDERGLLTDDGD